MGPHEVSSDALVKLKRNASATHMRIRVGLFSISSKSSYKRECEVQIFFNKNKSYDILRETRQKKNKTQTTRTKEKNRSKTFLFRPVFIFKNL